jgi:hypothetical protein
MVEFIAWLMRRREQVCLAQRVDSGPRLVGLGCGRRTPYAERSISSFQASQ